MFVYAYPSQLYMFYCTYYAITELLWLLIDRTEPLLIAVSLLALLPYNWNRVITHRIIYLPFIVRKCFAFMDPTEQIWGGHTSPPHCSSYELVKGSVRIAQLFIVLSWPLLPYVDSYALFWLSLPYYGSLVIFRLLLRYFGRSSSSFLGHLHYYWWSFLLVLTLRCLTRSWNSIFYYRFVFRNLAFSSATFIIDHPLLWSTFYHQLMIATWAWIKQSVIQVFCQFIDY